MNHKIEQKMLRKLRRIDIKISPSNLQVCKFASCKFADLQITFAKENKACSSILSLQVCKSFAN